MKLLKKLNILHIALLVLDAVVVLVLGFILGWSTPPFFIAILVGLLLVHPLIYLILMLMKESMVLEYDTPRFAPACMVFTLLAGCLIWYLFFHIEFQFSYWINAWYASILLAFSLPMIICKILQKRSDEKRRNSKGPKVVRNIKNK